MGEIRNLRVFSWIERSLPFLGMVLAVTGLATNLIVSKLAMSKGTNFFILSVYSNALATLILFPCGFLFHRSMRPPLTFPILCRIFLLAVFGMEGLNLKRSSDISKSMGTLVSIAGASIVTLYKGPAMMNKLLTLDLSSPTFLFSSQQNWILGGTLLAMAAFSTAAWSIVQTAILKIYPAEMIIVAIYCLFVTLQSTTVALIAEKDLSAWKLQKEMGLFAVFYAGVINISLRLYLMSWCLSRTGPLFVSLFNPLTIVISVVIGVIFFQEVLYFGSVAGAVVLVIGFYAVIWGKAKENMMKKDIEDNFNVQSLSHEVPLLQDKIEEA